MHKFVAKNIIFRLQEKIVGRKTFQYLDELEELQWVSGQALEEIRFRKLRELMVHAYKNIPFYTQRFGEASFDPMRMQAIEDIGRLPLLTKAEIRENLETMIWKDSPGGLHRYNTGGSSGEPLIFYFDRRRQAYDAAARAMTHRWWGIDIGDREIYLWGSPLEITKQDRLKELRDWLTNQLLLSAFELSPALIPEYIKKMRKFRPKCIFGYPSTIALFCRFASEGGHDLNRDGVEVIFSTAEVLYPHQKEIISKSFGGIPVVDGYGSREGGFISHECPKGSIHVVDQNIIVEYLRDGTPVGPGEDGEIVVTHLDNWAMPFIRYRTGDVAQFEVKNCECGRHLSIMKKIQGRTTDFIVTPDGRWQHGLSLIYVIRDIPGIEEFKIIQETVRNIKVLLKVRENLFSEQEKNRIVSGFKKRMGEEVYVKIEIVNEIKKDASGKHRYVISNLGETRTV